MASLNLRATLTSFCIICQLVLTLAALPLQAEEIVSAGVTNSPGAEQTREREGVDGIASYYAKRYNGRRTSSGHRHDPAGLTAAHPTLPLGTRVRVINLTNDKEVTVTVNDRCRARKQPFIDLSREAAKQLGFLGKGNARVRIIVLDGQTG